MNFVQIMDACNGLLPVVQLIRKGLFPIIQIGIPILLIIMGSVDLGKAVISSDEKEIKGATSKLIKRLIYAVAIFFIVTIVTVVMNLFTNVSDTDINGENTAANWKKCWQEAGK